MFDDDEAIPLGASKTTGRVNLGQDKDGGKPGAPPKNLPAESHRSKSVYLLSYRRRSTQAKLSGLGECALPTPLRDSVMASNKAFRAESASVLSANKARVLLIESQDTLVKEQLQRLQLENEGTREWVNKRWITEWLKQPVVEDAAVEEKRPLDNSSLFCKHHRLAPQMKGEAKLVSSKGVDWIAAHHSICGGRLPEAESLCNECVVEKFLSDRGSQKLTVSLCTSTLARLSHVARFPSPPPPLILSPP